MHVRGWLGRGVCEGGMGRVGGGGEGQGSGSGREWRGQAVVQGINNLNLWSVLVIGGNLDQT